MPAFELDGKVAIVTGGGAGINLVITKLLLERGCSVVIADLRLSPEAEALVSGDRYRYVKPASAKRPSVVFQQTDVTDWSQLAALWTAALDAFGRINIVVNGAGICEPGSSFWHAPGTSAVAQDAVNQKQGAYKTFSVNTIAPIRLAQIAIDYWFEHRDVEGNILWIASMAGYTHMVASPLYHASKAAVVSMVKCLAPLQNIAGIRNSALCPGPVQTSLIAHPSNRWITAGGDPPLEPGQVAGVALQLLTEPQYGNGSIVEVRAVQDKDSAGKRVYTRKVALTALYPDPAVGPTLQERIEGVDAETQRVAAVLKAKGMRSSDARL